MDWGARAAYLRKVDAVLNPLSEAGYRPRLISYSAVDRYLGFRPSSIRWVESDAGIADLARLFEGLRFPGTTLADAALDTPRSEDEGLLATWYFYCADDEERPLPVELLNFSWDPGSRSYRDGFGSYDTIRRLRGKGGDPFEALTPERLRPESGRWRLAAAVAIVLARYAAPAFRRMGAADETTLERNVRALGGLLRALPEEEPLSAEEQRSLLIQLMESRATDAGLDLLGRSGFVAAHWPELASMDEVDQGKEYHPEGNAWRHTLETFRYRKLTDPLLSLGLLLHDSGKPLSEASGGRRFDRHAELGARAARGFLGRLGFQEGEIESVSYLVRNHMMPAALPRLPLTRTREVLESPLFPLLLELYRCDESSSFKGLEGFYESCAAYRSYLRNVKNPYRSNDGKKLMRRLFDA